MRQLAAAILLVRSNVHLSFQRKISTAWGRTILIFILLILFAAEILRVYFIMPFPGSQVNNTVNFAYWLNINIVWIRLFGLAIVSFALIRTFKRGRIWQKILLSLILAGYFIVYFLFNFRFEADKIFRQPGTKSFMAASENSEKNKLVIGVVINGEARAYPIQLIGYHHQVMDTIANTPVMITYCTVCRTGRVFSPVVNGKQESFRLVGMDHFNAVFEDESTKSWWQQATGEAITGPLKGTFLKEYSSQQLTLEAWVDKYPNSLVMRPDNDYDDRYFKLEDYDDGTMQSSLVKRNILSWQSKSWIVGVKNDNVAKAYDWNELVKNRITQDAVNGLPVLVTMENDITSFHVLDRRVNGDTLSFQSVDNNNHFTDINTHSTWNLNGRCIAGPLKGTQLATVQAYNEFWHSWQTFQENTEKYSGAK